MNKPKMVYLQNHRFGVVCPFCGKLTGMNTLNVYTVKKSVAYQFRNAKSVDEFFISNLCQSCQDDFFGVD